MALRTLTIEATNEAYHETFLRFVPRVFPIDFRPWYAIGGWNEAYTVFGLFDGDEMIAAAARLHMECVVHGETVMAYQLGAVGVLPALRGRGHGRAVLSYLLEATPRDAAVFLFGNPTVVDFYLRFGFKRVHEHAFAANVDIAPSPHRLHKLSREQLGHHHVVARVGQIAEPVTITFGARDYGHLAAWYLSNDYADGFYYAPAEDAVIVAQQRGDNLHLLEILAPEEVDLTTLLPQVIDAPVRTLSLGFTPDRYVLNARVVGRADEEAPLFIRGPLALGERPFLFPALART